MNWRGKLVSAVIWIAFLSAIGTAIYTTAHEYVEDRAFAREFARDINTIAKGKMIVLDVRINDMSVQFWFMNRPSTSTTSTGMTEVESTKVNTRIEEAVEWAIINRGVTLAHFHWNRPDASGDLFTYSLATCLAQELAEGNPGMTCEQDQRWHPLARKNQRLRNE